MRALCARPLLRREDRFEKRRCIWKGGRFAAQSDYNSADCQHSVTAAAGVWGLCPQTVAASSRMARPKTQPLPCPAPSIR